MENQNPILPWLSPLILAVVLALCWIVYGLLHADNEYNQLYFVVGIPVLASSIGIHLLIRRITGDNIAAVWLIESMIVGGIAYYIWR